MAQPPFDWRRARSTPAATSRTTSSSRKASLTDRDLRIDDNHARGDYRAYFRGALKPDHIVPPGADGAIYSIHPIGVSLLVAPGFALGGYRGASLTIVLVGAIVGTGCCGDGSARSTGAAAATFGWLAIVTSAPFVLHGFAMYPEIPAALAVLVALAWRSGTADTRATAVVRGLALGALPWLGTKYAPMALVIGVLLAMRAPKDRARLVAIAAPAALLVVAWLALVCVAVGHALADGAVRHRTPDGAVASGGGTAGTLLRSGVRHRRGRAGAGDGDRGLVASLAARRRRAHAGRRDGCCRC